MPNLPPKQIKINRQAIQKATFDGLQDALEDIAEAIATDAKQHVPVRTGNLQRSISDKTNQGRTIVHLDEESGRSVSWSVPVNVPTLDAGTGQLSIRVGVYAPYAASIEFGSNPHEIRPDPSRTLTRYGERTNPHLKFPGKDGAPVYRKRVWHPGTPAQPFMRPAVDNTIKIASRIIRKALHAAYQRAGLLIQRRE